MAWVHRVGNLPQHLLLYSSRFTTWRFVTLPGIIVPSTFHPIPPRFHFEKNNQSGNTWYENRGLFNEENSHRLSIRENSSIYRRPTRGFNYPVEYERVDRQSGVFIYRMHVSIRCASDNGKREMKNRRRRDASIPGRKSASDLTEYKCSLKNEINMYIYIYKIDSWCHDTGANVYILQVSFRFIFLINETNRG